MRRVDEKLLRQARVIWESARSLDRMMCDDQYMQRLWRRQWDRIIVRPVIERRRMHHRWRVLLKVARKKNGRFVAWWA